METMSLDSMRRARFVMPALAFLLVVALLFSVQYVHASGSAHGPDSQDHVETMSPAHDSGAHEGDEVAEDCSVSLCGLCLAVIPAEHSVSTAPTTRHRSVARRAAPASPVERPYRPPILSA